MIYSFQEVVVFIFIAVVIAALLVFIIVKAILFKKYNLLINNEYISKVVYETEINRNVSLMSEVGALSDNLTNLKLQLQQKELELISIIEKSEYQRREAIAYQERMKSDFENLSNKVLEEKSEKFTKINFDNISQILSPLKDQIKDFTKNIEHKHHLETKDRVSLQKEIENLKMLNSQLSIDAQNLANALKGDSKIQGDWGEMQLKLILEKAGLIKGIHYRDQVAIRDAEGNIKRPDFIINLPNDKYVIIDSKVSLTAFEKYINSSEQKNKDLFLKQHLSSIKSHIQELSNKKYEQLYSINSPDYVLLFIPLETAFALATTDGNIFNDALSKDVVLVTNSTLLATLKTISFIWKQENQKQNVLEIAKQSGLLYDKFVGFIDDLTKIGTSLSSAQDSYNNAFNKLMNSPKKGDTLMGRAQKLKELGANAKKTIPDKFLN